MALIFIDGFDHQNDATDLASGDDWTTAQNLTVTPNAGRYGGKGVQFTAFGTNLTKTLSAAIAAGIVGFAYNPPVIVGNDDVQLDILNDSETVLFSLYLGSGVTIGSASAPSLFTVGKWAYIELNFTASQAAVLVNGRQVLSTSVAGANWQGLQLTCNAALPMIDDFYIVNPNLAGANKPLATANGLWVQTLFPNINDGSQDFTPSPDTSANWQNVSEQAMDGDTTYNFDNNNGDKDLFGIGSLTNNPSQIFAIAVRAAARNDGITSMTLNNRIVSNSVESDGSNVSLAASYAYQTTIDETDPNTSAAWVYGGVNDSLIGYQVNIVSTSGWNPSAVTGGPVTFSNANQTVTSTNGVTVYGLGLVSQSSGKVYCEFKLNEVTPGAGYSQLEIGVATSSVSKADFTHNGNNAMGVQSDGAVASASSGLASLTGYAQGAVVQMAIDFGNQAAWFNIDNGNWNGSSSANPATNTGGISIAAMLGVSDTLYPIWGSIDPENPTQNTLQDTTTNQTYAPPSGFTAWSS